MATTFKVPTSPKRGIIEIDNFLGVDLTNTGSNINETRSPNAPNMIRDVPGKVRKRMGYEVDKDFCEDVITDTTSYTALPLDLYNLSQESTGTKYTFFAIIMGYGIPKGQNYSIKIQYESTADCYLQGVGSYKENTGYLLKNTNGNAKDLRIDSSVFNNTGFEGTLTSFRIYFPTAGKIKINKFVVALVSNNRNFIGFSYDVPGITKTIDECYSHSNLSRVLVSATNISRTGNSFVDYSKNSIGTDGLKRLEITLHLNDAISYSGTKKNVIYLYDSNHSVWSFIYSSDYYGSSSYPTNKTYIAYVDSEILRKYSCICLYAFSGLSQNVSETLTVNISDADFIDYASYQPVNDVPIYGAHPIRSNENLDNIDVFAKNRFVYAFSSNNRVQIPLNTTTTKRKWYIGDFITSEEDVAIYLKYTATSKFKFKMCGAAWHTWYTLESGTHKEFRIRRDSIGFGMIEFERADQNCTLTIEELFIAHQGKDEPIPDNKLVYSPAPEVIGDTFNASYLYSTSSTERVLYNSHTVTGNQWNAAEVAGKYYTFGTPTIVNSMEKNTVYRVKGTLTINSATNFTKADRIVAGIKIHKNDNTNKTVDAKVIKEGNVVVSTSVPFDFYISTDCDEDTTNKFVSAELYFYMEGCTINPGTTGVFTSHTLSQVKIAKAKAKRQFTTIDDKCLIHVGTDLYVQTGTDYTRIYTNMNKARSKSWQLERDLYIVDGKNYLVYDDVTGTVTQVYGSDKAYIPLLYYAKATEKGTLNNATKYESINLLTPAYEERFNSYGEPTTVTNTQCQLSRAPLDAGSAVRVWTMTSSGEWQERYEGLGFNVNRTTGLITFTFRVGDPPLTGEDNIKIQARRTPEGYGDRIKKCRFGALFGVNGASDRLFLSGNPEYINYDWYSGYYDFTYFPDDGYAKLGLDSSEIKGYSIINNYLAVHKDENEPTQGVIIRSGDLVDDKPSFRIINTLQGEGAVASYSFAYLETEPLFLTRSGIFAITASDVTGEKYSQNRSFYLNGALTQEIGLKDAYAIIYNDMYWLFVNNKVYILDGLQATQTDKGSPYATRQYVGFLLTNIPANVAWVNNGALWFGTTDGRVCRFHTDKLAAESYNDNGEAIESWWETPDLDGSYFYKNKTFRYMAVRLKSNIKTGAKLSSQTRGLWTLFKDCRNISNKVFKFSEITFSDFTFNHDTSDVVVSSKLRVKKIDKARFKIENSELNEPFGIQNVALEYVESGNFKG